MGSFALIKRSSSFAAQLRGGFHESQQQTLAFAEWPQAVMQTLLSFIYSGQGPPPVESSSQFVMLAKLCEAAVYFDEPELVAWLQSRTLGQAVLAGFLLGSNFPVSQNFDGIATLWSVASKWAHAEWLASRCESLLALFFEDAVAINALATFPSPLFKRMLPRILCRTKDDQHDTLAKSLVQCAKATAGQGQHALLDEILECGAKQMLKAQSSGVRSERSRSPIRGIARLGA